MAAPPQQQPLIKAQSAYPLPYDTYHDRDGDDYGTLPIDLENTSMQPPDSEQENNNGVNDNVDEVTGTVEDSEEDEDDLESMRTSDARLFVNQFNQLLGDNDKDNKENQTGGGVAADYNSSYYSTHINDDPDSANDKQFNVKRYTQLEFE
ncbi:unnamed protein product [Ambrosiozyma monospora]|uniref:Unnamed protein product n=1 Tax=Ambrosiozyma monospora TaxID=43982 RepID=A0ACB5TLN1_AMBMO|nr:unnamed protein product [Ambrosiozyma monospora]